MKILEYGFGSLIIFCLMYAFYLGWKEPQKDPAYNKANFETPIGDFPTMRENGQEL